MKIVNYILSIILIGTFSSCHDILDIENRGAINPDDVFKNDYMAEAYVNDIYARYMPGWPWGSSLASEADNFDKNLSVLFREDGADQSVAGSSFEAYNNIRRLNEFFVQMKDSPIENGTKLILEAQIHFWRAWAYYGLVSVHGGVPLLLTPQEITDDLKVKRNSTSECIKQIVNDLGIAIENLPSKWDDSQYGRITKGAAMAFKGRVLLHFASPQWELVSWEEAHKATSEAKKELEDNGYSLYKGTKYDDIWFNEMNSSIVMVKRYDPSISSNNRDAWIRPLAYSSMSIGTYRNIPHLELVNSFPMNDGTAYNPDNNNLGFYWKDRDPRFYANFSFHGDDFGLPEMDGKKLWIVNTTVESQDGSKTGFFCRKALNKSLDVPNIDKGQVDWPEIRMAEVLLNYAETANETGDGNEALRILKLIRERAGILNSDDRYGLAIGIESDKSLMRDAILLERKIEFAFEGKRTFDLKRHKLYAKKYNGKKRTGLLITPKDENSIEWLNFKNNVGNIQKTATMSNDTIRNLFNYEIVERDADNINWQDKNYYLPIHTDYLDQNENLIQNMNWGGNFDPLK
jgi:hypothetical protein